MLIICRKLIPVYPENYSNHTIGQWGQVAEFSHCSGR